MELITLTHENLAKEHICCAISSNTDCQVASKKAWLAKRFDDGLVFTKGAVRGKCFIEYIPAENAWAPVNAAGYMYIQCLWVSGQYAGQGNADLLLESCIADSKSKGKKGLVILSGQRKLPFLADPAFLKHKGFIEADRAEPHFVLYYLPLCGDSGTDNLPQFKTHAKKPHTEDTGFVLYYSHQCPFTAKYVPLIAQAAQAKGIPFKTVLFETAESAQNAPAVCSTYSLFYNGQFITNEILSAAKFEKIAAERMNIPLSPDAAR